MPGKRVVGGRTVVRTVRLSLSEEALLNGTKRGAETDSDVFRLGLHLLSKHRAGQPLGEPDDPSAPGNWGAPFGSGK
jgi:hypothetical protein